ncbi:MAG TPA: YafY family protein [Polyangiaceae bacterium]|nr:YafY family protein [Polyangiaceae bacterium]
MPGTSARLLRLLALLQARKYWPGPELAERLEITTRTLRRDIDRLRELGYPVQAASGVAGGYQLGAGATLPPLLLEDDEALAVALGLLTTASGAVVGLDEAALRALAKLEQVLPSRLQRRMGSLRASLTSLESHAPKVEASVLGSVAAACRDRDRLQFRYEDARGQSRQRDVEPAGLVHMGGRWYLVAWDLERVAFRTFRLDRIAKKVSLGPRFSPRELPEGGDLRAYVARQVTSVVYPVRAEIEFAAPLATLRERVPPGVGMLEALDRDRCLLKTGAHSMSHLALHIALLQVDFVVRSPPEMIEYLERLRSRLDRALPASSSG